MMWLGYRRTIRLWILATKTFQPIGSVQTATHTHSSYWEDGIHWRDDCLRIRVVGGCLSGILNSGWIGDNLDSFREIFSLFLGFCLFIYYIGHIDACRAVLKVHCVGFNLWDTCLREMHSGSNRTPCMAITYLAIQVIYPAEVSPHDTWNLNVHSLMGIMIFITQSQSKTLRHACYLPLLVGCSCPSKEYEVYLQGQAKMNKSLTR